MNFKFKDLISLNDNYISINELIFFPQLKQVFENGNREGEIFINYLNFPVQLDTNIDNLKNKNPEEFYKKLAFIYMTETVINVLENSKIGFYSSRPKEIAGYNYKENDAMYYNESGYYIDTYPKFINLEQIIFNQFLQKLKLDPNQRKCIYCGRPFRGRRDKKFCEDSCRAQYSREKRKGNI